MGTSSYSGWSIEVVDSDGVFPAPESTPTSIALDSSGYPHISYVGYIENLFFCLKYTFWDGNSWNIETVDSEGDVGFLASIALDSNDCPHISYYDWTNGDLEYARWTGSAWNIETVATNLSGVPTSIALDSKGSPHISYIGRENFVFENWETFGYFLRYARWTGDNWNIETVDPENATGSFTPIALDSSDYPHISYYSNTDNNLKYTCLTGSSWSTETVDSEGDVGWGTSIALDADGHPHISYLDNTNNNLKYARWGQKIQREVTEFPLVLTIVASAIITAVIGIVMVVKRGRSKSLP